MLFRAFLNIKRKLAVDYHILRFHSQSQILELNSTAPQKSTASATAFHLNSHTIQRLEKLKIALYNTLQVKV